ncbi:hypothetical protein DB88DRAFT_485490 [Papiliotrema laurentii]|uniref:Yeast cell wall synthesis Kre9/Knh1-like N-terminal domain-containing protein n=1 Tax=Papiliotrema laurentii TaxID=5418 RepID=A0AAD9FTL1_PAPLA|nr:hypothetical protein DB88DRAFT_485490 [Papiliotrema laurentii]
MFANLLSTGVLALAFAQSALAGVYITNPVATTNAIGGQVLNVRWADNGQAPSFADIGVCSIDLYTGSVNQQTFLQNLAASVDVSKTSEINATIDPKNGPTGAYYFVRFRSANLKDSKNPQYNYQAYSSKFEIDSMTGTFNATVLAQLAADNTTAATTASSSNSTSANSAAVSASASKSGSSASASASKATGAAAANMASPAAALVAFVGVASYFVL